MSDVSQTDDFEAIEDTGSGSPVRQEFALHKLKRFQAGGSAAMLHVVLDTAMNRPGFAGGPNS